MQERRPWQLLWGTVHLVAIWYSTGQTNSQLSSRELSSGVSLGPIEPRLGIAHLLVRQSDPGYFATPGALETEGKCLSKLSLQCAGFEQRVDIEGCRVLWTSREPLIAEHEGRSRPLIRLGSEW